MTPLINAERHALGEAKRGIGELHGHGFLESRYPAEVSLSRREATVNFLVAPSEQVWLEGTRVSAASRVKPAILSSLHLGLGHEPRFFLR